MRNICLFSDDFRKFPIGEFLMIQITQLLENITM